MLESAGQRLLRSRVFHVFLSHSSADKPAVEQIAQRLRERGLHPYLDKWHLVRGAPWQPALQKALEECETAAIFFGPSGLGTWQHEELQLALDRAVRSRNDFRVISVLLPGADPDQLRGFIRLRTWADFRAGLDSEPALEDLVSGILGRAPAGDVPPLPDEPAPYRGLLPFDEAYSEFFFGRDADIDRTLKMLDRQRLVAVVGPSGCGKSSLVLGGVLPRLKRQDGIFGPGVHTWTLRPGDRPLRALADTLSAHEPAGQQRLSLSDSLHRRFLAEPDGLSTALGTLTADKPGPCVLVVDQLEELFTHASEHGGTAEVAPFVAQLRAAALERNSSLRILVTLRADFFDHSLSLAPLRELLQDRVVLLGSLGDEAFRDVILRPAQKVGAYLEKDLLTAILRDVSREPGALPLLEDALDQLWRARKGAWLTMAAYEASGGISQALQRRAQACYEALSDGEREVARLLLVRLISLGEGRDDTRRRVPRTELTFSGIPREQVTRVLQTLSGPRARLIVVDEGNVEVAHEVLIRTWPTLRQWLDEDRRDLHVLRRLREAAVEWHENRRADSYLYGDARLRDAEELRKNKPTLLNQLEGEFLEASILQRDRHQREEQDRTRRELESLRRLAEETNARLEEADARRKAEAESAKKARRSARILAVLGAAFLASAILLYGQYQRADQEKRVAFSRELVLSARQNLLADPQRSLLLLQEAQRRAPVDNLGELLDTWSQQLCMRVLRGHREGIHQAAFSPDGARVLTASFDGTARVWEASSGKFLATLQGHSGAVWSATFSPDGARVLTASPDGTARVWDATSGRSLVTLQGHSEAVRSATFSPDGSLVGTASFDGTARVWEASSGALLATLQGHSGAVWSATFSPDGARVLTASVDRTARVWDVASGQLLVTLQGHSDRVAVATFNRDGSRILTASLDGTARVWEASSGRLLTLLPGHSGEVRSAMFSPDGTRVLTASFDGTARLWDASSGELYSTLMGFHAVPSATFSPDGALILTASGNGTAHLWDASSGRLVRSLLGHSDAVWSVAFSPDGSYVLTASQDGTARLWDAPFGKQISTLLIHPEAVRAATFSPDGSRVLTAPEDNTARVWDAATGQPLLTLQGHSNTVWSAAFSRDGSRILTASRDGTARLWDATSGQCLHTLQGHSQAVVDVAFSPDGARVLTASEDGTARLWDAASGKSLGTLVGHTGAIGHAMFSPDGTRVFTASDDGAARLWDASSGQPLFNLQGHSSLVVAATFSPSGERVLTASRDGTAHLWDVASGRILSSLPGASQAVVTAAFSPDGSRLLTASQNGTALLRDTSTGRKLSMIRGSSRAEVVTFSPDGARILTASQDGTARLWDASSGRRLATFLGHSLAVVDAAFSPDGARVLTASQDGTTRLWPGWRWDPEAFAKYDVGRPLTCQERRTFLHEDISCPEEP